MGGKGRKDGRERQEGWQGKAGRTKGRDRKDDTNVDTVASMMRWMAEGQYKI